LKEVDVPLNNFIDNITMRKEIISASYFDDLIVKPRPPPKNPHIRA